MIIAFVGSKRGNNMTGQIIAVSVITLLAMIPFMVLTFVLMKKTLDKRNKDIKALIDYEAKTRAQYDLQARLEENRIMEERDQKKNI